MVLSIQYIRTATILSLLFLLTACSGGSDSPGSAAIPDPNITSFETSASIVTASDNINVTAVFENGTGVIDNGVGAVVSGKVATITPATTTTYTLTVTNSVGVSVTSQVNITMVPAPIINSFNSSLILITAGDSIELTADFSNGTAAVDNGVGNVQAGTAVTVTPATTTTYTLTVTNAAGTTLISTVTVTVVTVPTVLNFTSASAIITVGDSVDLTAIFAGGAGSIDNGVGVVDSEKPYPVTPAVDTTYTITVTGSSGLIATSVVTVTVVAAPTITSFISSVAIIAEGNSVNLTSTFANGTGSIDNGVGAVVSGIAIAVTPTADTTYTLTVTNTAGTAVTSTVSITVILAPTITSFISSAIAISNVSSVDLTAVFANETATVDNGVGTIMSGIPVTVTPSTTTIYTLTVTNSLGVTLTSAVTITVTDVSLDSLSILNASLDQVFQSTQLNYTTKVGFLIQSLNITATTATAGATITVNGVAIGANNTSQTITLNEGSNDISVVVTATNGVTSTYLITVTRMTASEFAEQAYIKASNIGPDDKFASSIALSGDTLVVGAPIEDSDSNGIATPVNDNALTSGAVYVFFRTGTTWTEQAYLKASNIGATDFFGFSVAISGDTLAVGAIGEDSSTNGISGAIDEAATDSGAVYIFTRSGSTWTEQAYLKASNIGAADNFGIAITLIGNTLAVSANGEDSSTNGISAAIDEAATDSGAVYVFTRTGTTWTEQAYLKASNIGAADNFGSAIALTTDTLVVGANHEDSSTNGISAAIDEAAVDSGALYVFTRTGTTWTEQAYLKASNIGIDDQFGSSVALNGDTLVAGAQLEDSSNNGINAAINDSTFESGAVYVFIRTGTSWSEQAYLKASNIGANDYFGISVALNGDTLAVGAHLEDSSSRVSIDDAAIDSGAVYIFTRTGTTWTEQAYLKASNIDANDYFGTSIALFGDTLAVGANYEDSSTNGISGAINNAALDSGAVYIFK